MVGLFKVEKIKFVANWNWVCSLSHSILSDCRIVWIDSGLGYQHEIRQNSKRKIFMDSSTHNFVGTGDPDCSIFLRRTTNLNPASDNYYLYSEFWRAAANNNSR